MPPVLTKIQVETLKEALESLKSDCEQELCNVGEIVMHRETMDNITNERNETIAACDSLLKLFKLQDPKPLMDQFEDKEDAVAFIWCQRRHFKQISDRLDSIGVPNEIAVAGVMKTMTVQQRVAVLIKTLLRFPEEEYNWESSMFYTSNGVDEPFPFEPEVVDPEEIYDIIHGEKPEPWHWGEGHNVNG